jgi:hypothetical protein
MSPTRKGTLVGVSKKNGFISAPLHLQTKSPAARIELEVVGASTNGILE